MPSLRLSNPFRRGDVRPSLKQRAAGLRAAAAKVLHRPKNAAVPASASSALAAACDWAIGYRVWVNRSDAYDLSDEALAAELAPLDKVMTRAITEPSAGLGDIQAKARLLMDDLIEGGHADERYDDARLTMTVLREIIALPSKGYDGGVGNEPLTIENTTLDPIASKAPSQLSPDADQSRRVMVVGSLAAMVPLPAQAIAGTILGTAPYTTGRDLTAVAEAWIDDARDLGMHVLIGPDGEVWRAMPIGAGERYEARDAHWFKMNNRPPLLRAVHAAVKRRSADHG